MGNLSQENICTAALSVHKKPQTTIHLIRSEMFYTAFHISRMPEKCMKSSIVVYKKQDTWLHTVGNHLFIFRYCGLQMHRLATFIVGHQMCLNLQLKIVLCEFTIYFCFTDIC